MVLYQVSDGLFSVDELLETFGFEGREVPSEVWTLVSTIKVLCDVWSSVVECQDLLQLLN